MPTPFARIIALAVLLLPGAGTAAVYQCLQDGQKIFQDHPCGSPQQAVTSPAEPQSEPDRLAARQDCEHWAQLGYQAAVARDRRESQEAVLARLGQDGLDDGEREAVNWAFREFHSSPEHIKRIIRADCLQEQLQESPRPLFAGNKRKQPGEFAIGDKRYVLSSMQPWTIDHTQSGKLDAAVYLFATGADPGKITIMCKVADSRLSDDAADQQLLNAALNTSALATDNPYPKIVRQQYANGSFRYLVRPLPVAKGSADAVLKQPRHIVYGLYDKDELRCSSRIETYLPNGPAQTKGIQLVTTIFALAEKP